MSRRKPDRDLRFGYTTGACATAAAAAAARRLWLGRWAQEVEIALPRGERARFTLCDTAEGPGWARAAVQKDAGDDPDVTHGAVIAVTLRAVPEAASGGASTGAAEQIAFAAGDGVGRVTKPGLPLPPGEPAINPVPRQMIAAALREVAAEAGIAARAEVEVSVPGGAELAQKTWNPRLGILGGISILGTTGIVRPYSCAAWIASIHRGIDVARAGGLTHAAAATGATSERVAQARFGLPDHGMLDMGDFAGGLLKYLKTHPLPRLTLAGGVGKLSKLAQGALDLHSARSQVDFAALADLAGCPEIAEAHTALDALQRAGPGLAAAVAAGARRTALGVLAGAPVAVDVLVVSRAGAPLAEADAAGARILAPRHDPPVTHP